MKKYLILILCISILIGLIFPFSPGPKNPSPIANAIYIVWFIYVAIVLIVTFLVKLAPKIREYRRNEVKVIGYEPQNSTRKNAGGMT